MSFVKNPALAGLGPGFLATKQKAVFVKKEGFYERTI